MKSRLKKGDQVIVIAGKFKGKTGEILKVTPQSGRAIVQGVGLVIKHRKPSQANPKGGIEHVEAPLHISNLMLVDPTTKKRTRVGIRVTDSGERVRFAKKSGTVID